MKKLSLLLILLMILFVGCNNQNLEKTNPEETKAKGYVFENKGITIAMHSEVEPVLKALGDSMDYFEADSCAFQGMEKIYTYSGFELHTYEMDGVDYVANVMFLDDSVSTKEGISLYDNLDSVIEKYGDKYTENLGVYTYELDKTKLSFMVEDDEVTSIEYIAVPD